MPKATLTFRLKELGRMGGDALGPGGECICPKCGHVITHETGQPCTEIDCPECGQKMTRKETSS